MSRKDSEDDLLYSSKEFKCATLNRFRNSR